MKGMPIPISNEDRQTIGEICQYLAYYWQVKITPANLASVIINWRLGGFERWRMAAKRAAIAEAITKNRT